MGAYNWILIEGECPACKRVSSLKAQTHAASDYGGDVSGRFHDRVYHLKDSMAWWPMTDQRYPAWRPDGAVLAEADNVAEACYTNCVTCGGKLYAVIEFKSLSPRRVVAIGLEEQWPEAYPK